MPFAIPLTRREAALRHLRDEIITGHLTAGKALKDAEIAAQLRISITPVREAIAQLVAEGLVVTNNRTRYVARLTPKSALDLIDVICVLAGAGFGWGIPHLTETDMQQLRLRLDQLSENLHEGNVAKAAAAGTDFSSIIFRASGNQELQAYFDVAMARTVRLLALTAESEAWHAWVAGYTDTLQLLECGDQAGAIKRYRQIYEDFRALVSTVPFDEPDPAA